MEHGRSDSYRVATISTMHDDNKTADGRDKMGPEKLEDHRNTEQTGMAGFSEK
ncbi:hypothetical protein L9F63_003543, partial [Diploptera punctata]